jgi:glycosyltransferase involved in cell wall biosynthesis
MITMLHVTEALETVGGTPRELLSLATHIDRGRATLTFVCFRPSPLAGEFVSRGAAVYEVPSSRLVHITKTVLSVAKRVSADIISTHFTRSLLAGYLAARSIGIPVIHNEHSSTHYRRGAGRLAARFVLPRTDAVLCNSRHILQSVDAAYPYVSSKLVNIGAPVERPRMTGMKDAIREKFRIEPGHFVIGYVGGMIPERDHGTLIEAFHIVHRRFSHTTLLLVGDGPQRPALEGLIDRRGLRGVAHVTGFDRRAGDYLAVMDLYVNPCLDEGFGIAVGEAMLTGIPVVLSRAGAHPELIVEGESGCFFPVRDPDALASVIGWLIEHPELRAKIGAAGCLHAEKYFSPARYADEYLAAVEDVVRRRASIPQGD